MHLPLLPLSAVLGRLVAPLPLKGRDASRDKSGPDWDGCDMQSLFHGLCQHRVWGPHVSLGSTGRTLQGVLGRWAKLGDGCREEDWLAKLNSSAQLKKIPSRQVFPMLGVSAQTQASPSPFPGNIMSRGCSQPVPGSGVRETPIRQGLFWLPLPGCPCTLCRCPHDSRYSPTPDVDQSYKAFFLLSYTT